MKLQDVILLFLIMESFCGWSQELNHKYISYNPETKKLDYFITINSEKSDMLFDEKGVLIKKWVGRPPRDIDNYIDRQ